MAIVKAVNRSASAAFAPDAPYLAAGTMAGAVDLSFSSTANLDIFELDFTSDDRELILAGSVASSERFNRLSWGKPLPNSEEFSLGLIAGGLVDGTIGLWNPKRLISSGKSREGPEASENAFVGHLSNHTGPVRGLEFNVYTSNLLASGADEGKICIWDIANPVEPTHYPPLKGSGSSAQSEISYVSWNSKVQHVLASTSLNGTTVVWDLRKQKPVISFSDSIRRRCSVLQWHPDFATQLIVASDEDGSPALMMWDMRNVMSPVKEFAGHTKGVIAMSWCPIDSSYLLTCAKDNRTICWDVVSGEFQLLLQIVSELPSGTNWNFDVHWYPKCPGVISASSFDGKIGIYNIEGCDRYVAEDGNFGAASLRAPKWYKRGGGVSFGFGGKLVSFHSTNASDKPSEVYVRTVVTEHGLVSRSSDFETMIQDGERSQLRLLCEKKSQDLESNDEKETWGFLKVMFEEDGAARTKLLSHLGFSLPVEEKVAKQDDISDQVSALGLGESVTSTEQNTMKKEPIGLPFDNGEDFFNNLPSPKTETPLSTSGNNFDNTEAASGWEETPSAINGLEESTDSSSDDAILRALVVGDYKTAVAHCISANRMADALVIAHVGGTSLWESTRNQYLKTSQLPYLKVVSAMVSNDLMSLVKSRPLKSWKETLALLCTFAQQDEWTLLCDTLGSRLFAAGETLPATLCFICAGNVDKTIEIWSRTLSDIHDGISYFDLLQDLMEKTIVFALATRQKRFSASLCKLVEKYAEILASQGQLSTAMKYLKVLGTEELSPELTILQDRIALSISPDKDTMSTAFENSQLQTGPGYSSEQPSYGMNGASQHYYPESPMQNTPSTLNGPYAENYQSNLGPSFKGYTPPSSYQPAPPSSYQPTPPSYQPTPSYQPNPPSYQPAPQQNVQQPSIFLPAPVPHVPQPPLQGNIAAPPGAGHPTIKPFVPTNPPALRNVEQYQQPTLGSQLYPGQANPSFPTGPHAPGGYDPNLSQVNPPLGQRMPQVVAPSPNVRGFAPVTNPGVQRPNVSAMQPPSPTQAAPVQPPASPAVPPPTVQTVDTSNVPAEQKPVIATLTRLFNETSEALGGPRANPAKKREIDDNSKKLGALFAKLNSGDISKNAAEKLVQLCRALDNGDFSTALQIQVLLTTSDWDECNFWLATLKRMIKTRQNFR
nr:protein transport protein SEC31 homolog B [Ipomoea batatas]